MGGWHWGRYGIQGELTGWGRGNGTKMWLNLNIYQKQYFPDFKRGYRATYCANT